MNRSGNGKGEKLAYAYHLQQLVRTSFVTGNNETIIKANFTKAARAFEECSRLPQAATCYENINMFREAGELYSESNIFGDAACYYREAADMLNRSVDDDENTIDATQYLLRLCRINVLKEIITDFTSLSTMQELNRLQTKADKSISKIIIQTELSKSLMEESRLYIFYLNKNLSKVYECRQFFMKNQVLSTEIIAIIMWLQIPSPSEINIKYWDERLQCLLRLCNLAFLYIATQKNDDITKILKEFMDIFFGKIQNPQKLKISFYNPLYYLMDIKHKNEAITDSWMICDVDVVYQSITKFLITYIYDRISKVGQDGKDNPNKLARLQYTVVRQLDVLYRHGLLCKEFLDLQNWWAENLVECHIRYQSLYTSCPEVTYMALANLPIHVRDGLINEAYKKRLFNKSKNANDFDVMLKYMLVIQQLHDKTVIEEFNREMSKTKVLAHPNDLTVGFEYYCGNYQAIPVGRYLSQFFSFLYNNKVISAIISSKSFINYALINIKQVNLVSSESLGDLTSLVEFTTSLIFAVGQKYCDLCLPRAYLINYFESFTAKPLIPDRYTYSRKNYLSAINNTIDQVQQLLDLLFCKEQDYLTIILRLIRLLILIGLNESKFEQNILNLFKQFISKYEIFSTKIKKYLKEDDFTHLEIILHNDLKEKCCDSLVFVHHQCISQSKFAFIKKNGIKSLKYNSIEEFRFSLRKIISSVTEIPEDKLALLDSLVES
ncbi:7314_t:CDS:2 [Funneliformis mosseae]|uniref:7314_t:CDS:1 n=1 Tax=Funneliformis mosseae TaxID=27381 RepID=A0A9N8ZA23_FUNMO|nr:7314_t:CDS:2 [Funneliformis mosseae]